MAGSELELTGVHVRRIILILFLTQIAGLADTPRALRPRQAQKPPEISPETRVTLSYLNADLFYVVRVLAREMSCYAWVGPTVRGSVTIQLNDVPAVEALRLVLDLQPDVYDYRIQGNIVAIGPPDKLAEILSGWTPRRPKIPDDSPRMEYLLNDGLPAAKVIDFFRGQYPDVEFTQHPTTKGFFARGSREDLLSIKRELELMGR